MKRSSCAVFALPFVLAGIQLSAQVQGQWVTTGTMQTGRELHAQVLTGTQVVAIGGVDSNGKLLASVEVYNSGPGKWTLTGSMTDARELFPAVALSNGKVL